MNIEISVIVPTFNGRQYIGKCLEGLALQDFPKDAYEVIVVDDGSFDNTVNIIYEVKEQFKETTIRYNKQDNKGPSAARNNGLKYAKGEIIAFTDDDCIPDPKWLFAIKKTFDDNPNVLGVGGKTITIPENVTPFTHQVEDDLDYSYPSCNVAYKKWALEKVGGFDEQFPFPGHSVKFIPTNEDWDLTFKIQDLGKIIYNPKILVVHPPKPSSFFKELYRMRLLESEWYLFKKHPEKYKNSVHKHPWRVILYHHMFVQFILKFVRFFMWAFEKPLTFLKFFMLLVLQRIFLLTLIPGFFLKYSFLKRNRE
jgi:glycosyltransferase involved in cell wall biosynthesis